MGGSILSGEDTTVALFNFKNGSKGLFFYSWAYRKTIDTLIADHKLLDKLYGNLLKWKEEENPLYTNRLPLFYKTLTYHNSQEEKLVFPAWKHVEKEQAERALKEAHDIIESAGLDTYMKETGVSREMINYIFL